MDQAYGDLWHGDSPYATDMNRPLVTIITPAYNRAAFLDETIHSVLSQDYPNIEYIVLDDGSTDNTRQVLEKYSGQLHWETHPNMGEARTVCKGFGMARGEIVCVVNSDDPLLPGAVSAAVSVMRQRPEVLAVYSDWSEIGPNSELIKCVALPNYDIFNMMLTFNVGMGPGTFIRHRAIQMVGMRDLQFRYAGDLEFWFRLALHGPLAHIPTVLATHRTHPDSASVSDRGARMAEELICMVKKIYTSPLLPVELRMRRSEVLGMAHHIATFYCGVDRRAKAKHRLASIWCDPGRSVARLCQTITAYAQPPSDGTKASWLRRQAISARLVLRFGYHLATDPIGETRSLGIAILTRLPKPAYVALRSVWRLTKRSRLISKGCTESKGSSQ